MLLKCASIVPANTILPYNHRIDFIMPKSLEWKTGLPAYGKFFSSVTVSRNSYSNRFIIYIYIYIYRHKIRNLMEFRLF